MKMKVALLFLCLVGNAAAFLEDEDAFVESMFPKGRRHKGTRGRKRRLSKGSLDWCDTGCSGNSDVRGDNGLSEKEFP